MKFKYEFRRRHLILCCLPLCYGLFLAKIPEYNLGQWLYNKEKMSEIRRDCSAPTFNLNGGVICTRDKSDEPKMIVYSRKYCAVQLFLNSESGPKKRLPNVYDEKCLEKAGIALAQVIELFPDPAREQ